MKDPRDRELDQFRYDPAEVAALQERFTIGPVSPDAIRDRAAAGETLVTTDIPGVLGNNLGSTADAAIALYRLVQLFGTPNVVGLEAGVDQPSREDTTWQYLFRIQDAEGAVDGRLLSVYDYRTELSVGLSAWVDAEDASAGARAGADADEDRVAREPVTERPSTVDHPDDEVLRQLVQLVLSAVEHPVEATVGGRHV